MCWDNDATMRGFEKRIKKLKSRYAGETCFVIGNGPSLKLSDLEQLRQSYTFGVNKIYDLYTMTEWRPTFYVLQDFKLMQAIFSEAEQATRASRLRFFNMRMLEQSPFNMPPPPNDLYFRLVNQWKEDPQRTAPSFSEDLSVCAYEGYTVLYTVLQLAVYLGFSRIILLGVDHSYSASNSKNGILSGLSAENYFAGFRPVENAPMNAPCPERSTAAFIAAKSYCATHGISILNATRGGRLEVFPRISFDQAEGV